MTAHGDSSQPDLAERVALGELAVELAERAGALITEGRSAAEPAEVDTKSSPTDVVTEMDRRSERFLVDRLGELRPGDAVLGEEGGRRDGHTGVRWVVDPIDGTVNYLYGIPAYAVSVAARYGDQTVAGAVHSPSTGETFHAVYGGGAWLGRRRLTGATGRAPATGLGQALIGTGFAYDAARRAEQARVVAELLPVVRDIRRIGAASLDLCSVAAGRLDGYFERGLSPWDYAAGALVATEAGMVVRGLRGRGASDRFVLACAPGIADAFTALLEGLDADPDPAVG